MQWLIDLVIEAIGVPPCYIDRGQYAGADFAIGDFTIDSAWHTLDLSGIVPAGAKGVCIRVRAGGAAAGLTARMRPNGTTMSVQTCMFRTQVAGVDANTNPTLGISTDRKLDYYIGAGAWTRFDVNIRGWIL